MTTPGFILGEATAAERIARDRLTFEAWGGRLTREQYLDRERFLRQTDHGRLAMHTWVLRVPNGVVMASCETFRLPLMPTGAVEVIATVYVDPPLRGAKMASRLIDALVAQRREAGLDGLVLFSEVGPELYARSGFKPLPAFTRDWAAATSPPDPGAGLIHAAELPEALAWRERLRATEIELRLVHHLFDWHHARSRFYSRVLNQPLTEVLGARVSGVQALWAPDFVAGVLRVLDVTGPAGASLDPVMAVASSEAAAVGLPKVELWDDSLSRQLVGGRPAGTGEDVPMGLAFSPRGELFLGPLSRACWA